MFSRPFFAFFFLPGKILYVVLILGRIKLSRLYLAQVAWFDRSQTICANQMIFKTLTSSDQGNVLLREKDEEKRNK